MASLAGRPPFATDIPDSVYAQSQPQARYRQPPKDDPNARTSAYNHYDAYLNGGNGHSHPTHVAPAATAQSVPQHMPVPLAAPKPGYVAPIAVLNMSQLSDAARSPPGLNSAHMHPGQHETARMPPAVARQRPPPVAPISVPSTPHPLPPTMTPILPVFARPSMPADPHDIKWGPEPIMRGNSEEKLLPRRGEKGDDFWRRFSMVVREESRKPSSQKQSAWLRETQSGANRMSIWVWIIGLLIFSCAGLGIGLGWYLAHKAPPHQDPGAIGGHANDGTTTTSSPAIQGATGTGALLSLSPTPHVTPTNTVEKRAVFPDPLPTPAPGAPINLVHLSHPYGPKHGSTGSRRSLKRAIM
ncbi:hypothetical protein DFH94DRAFT_754356 [Russula ochroleuca]|uniref:Uncharacterized protein n=1 Tax=Russula ochroleuca TaxID=152965 RepID=A0A9P5MTG9_9AGAM|nr:hypothetical protein DFH94DRAFT_754356 [Russula ochroleuca]